jgi:hypothetical protein
MQRWVIPALIFGLFVIWESPSFAEILKYEDKDGVIHFMNIPTQPQHRKVAPPNRTKAKPKKATSKKPESHKNVSGTAWPVMLGYVVTNYHVVKGCQSLSLGCPNGTIIQAKLEVGDESNDLALLSVVKEDVAKLPPALPLSESGPKLGAKVFTIGYPLTDVMGVKPKLTDGIVSGEFGIGDNAHECQITVSVQSGNSGSPLLNMNGEVVGIVSGKLNAMKVLLGKGDLPQNVNYAIKIQYLKALLESVKESHSYVPINELPGNAGSLEELAARVQNSVLLLNAK